MPVRLRLQREEAVDYDDDLLITHNAELRAELEATARHLSDERGVIVCVSGAWGSGKSSAVKWMLQEVADERHVAEFLASKLLTDDYGLERAVDGAVLEGLLRQLSRDELMKLLRKLGNDDVFGWSDPSNDDAIDRFVIIEKLLERKETPLRYGTELFDTFNKAATADLESTIIVFEDIDRIDEASTFSLLQAVNRWATARSLSFVLVSRSDHLERSIGGATGSADPSAITKYVHFFVEVPCMVDDRTNSYRFVSALVEQALDGVADERDAALELLLGEKDGDGSGSLLEPVVDKAVGSTPREVKELLNRVLLKLASHTDLESNLAREAVSKTVWPHEHRLLIPATLRDRVGSGESGDTASQVATKLLERARHLRLSNGVGLRTIMREELEGSELLGTGPAADLVDALLYLSHNDYGQHDGLGEVVIPGPDLPDASKPATIPETDLRFDLDHLSRPDNDDPFASLLEDMSMGSGSDDEVLRLSEQIQVAAVTNDQEAVRSLVRRLMGILESSSFARPQRLAPAVGNAALRAIRVGDNEGALRLHLAATQLDPDHSNVLQNFVDFLLDDIGTPGAVNASTGLLARLATGTHRGWRPVRTAILQMLHDVKQNASPAVIDAQIETIMASDFAEVDRVSVGSALRALVAVRQLDNAIAVTRSYIDSAASDEDDALFVIRALADATAKEGQERDEYHRLAVDVYELLLARAAHEVRQGGGDLHDILVNLAVVIYAMDYDEFAGLLFMEAYNEDLPNVAVRRLMTNWTLAERSDAELVAQIAEGTPIDVSTLALDIDKDHLPDVFYQGERWWLDHLRPDRFHSSPAHRFAELAAVRDWSEASPIWSESSPVV